MEKCLDLEHQRIHLQRSSSSLARNARKGDHGTIKRKRGDSKGDAEGNDRTHQLLRKRSVAKQCRSHRPVGFQIVSFDSCNWWTPNSDDYTSFSRGPLPG
eukprot:5074768-Pyramimonas_sp.AAC.1